MFQIVLITMLSATSCCAPKKACAPAPAPCVVAAPCAPAPTCCAKRMRMPRMKLGSCCAKRQRPVCYTAPAPCGAPVYAAPQSVAPSAQVYPASQTFVAPAQPMRFASRLFQRRSG